MNSTNRIYGLYLELRQKHGDARKFWPGWCAKRKSLKLREEIAIGAILTQRTNWRNVEMALANLRNQGALSIRGIYNLPRESGTAATNFSVATSAVVKNSLVLDSSLDNYETLRGKRGSSKIVDRHSLKTDFKNLETLAQLIRPAGFYHQKARRLWGFCRMIIEDYGGLDKFRRLGVGEAREKLLSLWGIGPETADSILLYSLGKPNFVVDEYTKRLFRREKLLSNYSYDYMKAFCEQNLPRDAVLYQDFHALIVVEEKGEKAAQMR